jgi:hypothetical protein
MKLFIVFVTITCFFFPGSCESSADYLSDNLIDLKDDCRNICGQINTNITDSKCGDPDKRNFSLLLVHDQHDRNEEETEYYEPMNYECVDKCPVNYQSFESDNNNYCVKNITDFSQDLQNAKLKAQQDKMQAQKEIKNAEKEIKEQSDDKAEQEQHDDKFDYTWWIVGGVGILIVVIISVVIGLFIKKRSGNATFVLPSERPILKF